MICVHCRRDADTPALKLQLGNGELMDFAPATHSMCRGGTWCDCQHRTRHESGHAQIDRFFVDPVKLYEELGLPAPATRLRELP